MKRKRKQQNGFTLLEVLASLLLATILFGGLSLYTGTWLRHWRELIDRSGREDMVAVILDRMVEDLEAAQPIDSTPDNSSATVRFIGKADTIRFVRPALGYEVRSGLDDVTYLIGLAGTERALIRARRDYLSDSAGEDLPLMRGEINLSFAYAGPNGALEPEWKISNRLPSLVRIELSGSAPRPWRRWALARLRVELPAYCGAGEVLAQCLQRHGSGS